MEQLVYNPSTKRYVKFGSANHKRLIREGILQPPAETMPTPKPKQRLLEQTQQQKMDTEIIQQSVSVVEKNKEKFKGLSQDESNDLIAKLLYDRLISIPSKKLVGRPIVNKPIKVRPSVIQRPILIRQKTKKKPVESSDEEDEESVAESQIETTDFSSESESD